MRMHAIDVHKPGLSLIYLSWFVFDGDLTTERDDGYKTSLPFKCCKSLCLWWFLACQLVDNLCNTISRELTCNNLIEVLKIRLGIKIFDSNLKFYFRLELYKQISQQDGLLNFHHALELYVVEYFQIEINWGRIKNILQLTDRKINNVSWIIYF